MRTYVVRQGDYLAKLAATMGFSADDVWNDDANEPLRRKGRTPNVLAPGDVLHVPEAAGAAPSVNAGASNRYRAVRPRASVKIRLRDANGAIAGEAFVVQGVSPPFEGTTDGGGLAAFDVPHHVGEVTLVLAGRGLSIPVLVGHLDPIDEPSGLRARLEHLGHLAPARHASDAANDAEVGPALRAFQRASGIEETGRLDDATRDALQSAHGA